MILLLDTHTFLWWLTHPETLSQTSRAAIEDPENQVFVSVFSLWEIAIKRTLGKLEAPIDLEHDVELVGFTNLGLHPSHIHASESLPFHHRDPFDRMLIAQAMVEHATLISRDDQFGQYDVPVFKA